MLAKISKRVYHIYMYRRRNDEYAAPRKITPSSRKRFIMIKLIAGLKGSGKTKTLIEKVNAATEASKGSVICLEKGDKLRYDIKYQARLIDVEEYNIDNAHGLRCFVAGLHASNSDITHIFIAVFMLPTAILLTSSSTPRSKSAKMTSLISLNL